MAKMTKSKVKSSKDRLRLSVFRSNKHIYAQIIDDQSGQTIAAASSMKIPGNTIEVAKQVGATVAEIALKNKAKNIVFDRGTYKYTGRIKALADAAREKGLNF